MKPCDLCGREQEVGTLMFAVLEVVQEVPWRQTKGGLICRNCIREELLITDGGLTYDGKQARND